MPACLARGRSRGAAAARSRARGRRVRDLVTQTSRHEQPGWPRDHYRFAVWNERAGSTDPQLLALALAGVTEGAPVGFVGDELVVPLRIPDGSVLESFFDESIEDLIALSPSDDDDHILPTAALTRRRSRVSAAPARRTSCAARSSSSSAGRRSSRLTTLARRQRRSRSASR
jgi:hypothetical protein